MKSARTQLITLIPLICLACCLSGCAVIGGIFKAGVWVGVIAVLIVAILIGWGIRAAMR